MKPDRIGWIATINGKEYGLNKPLDTKNEEQLVRDIEEIQKNLKETLFRILKKNVQTL